MLSLFLLPGRAAESRFGDASRRAGSVGKREPFPVAKLADFR
jgi:hypothetical protein